jgi:hypothetical protein
VKKNIIEKIAVCQLKNRSENKKNIVKAKLLEIADIDLSANSELPNTSIQ